MNTMRLYSAHFRLHLRLLSTSTFSELAQSRRSTKRFDPSSPIPPSTLTSILEDTLRTPTSFNLQPYAVILIKSPSAKETLGTAMLGGNVFRVRDAPVTAVFLSDLEPSKRIDKIMSIEKSYRAPEYNAMMPLAAGYFTGEGPWLGNAIKNVAAAAMSPVKPMPTISKVEVWSGKNAAMAAMSFIHSSTSHGLATCAMEGYDVLRVKEALRIPDRYEIPLMVSVGHSLDEEFGEVIWTNRLEVGEVFFEDTFGNTYDTEDDV